MSENQERRRSAYADTMEALREAEYALPDFTSDYDAEIAGLYEKIVNRPAFRYDPGADPLYESYRTRMVTEGERAMRDSVGQAASLTGGYGSSYAESAYSRESQRYTQAAQLEQQQYERREKSYQKLVNLISQAGYDPADEELARAGLTRAQAEALRQDFLRKNPLAAAGGYTGGNSSYTAKSSGSTSKPGEKEALKLAANQPGRANTAKKRRL